MGCTENYAANAMPTGVRVWDALYAVHTGEIWRTPGRCLVALVGVSLLMLLGSAWVNFQRVPSGSAERYASHQAPLFVCIALVPYCLCGGGRHRAHDSDSLKSACPGLTARHPRIWR